MGDWRKQNTLPFTKTKPFYVFHLNWHCLSESWVQFVPSEINDACSDFNFVYIVFLEKRKGEYDTWLHPTFPFTREPSKTTSCSKLRSQSRQTRYTTDYIFLAPVCAQLFQLVSLFTISWWITVCCHLKQLILTVNLCYTSNFSTKYDRYLLPFCYGRNYKVILWMWID